MGALIIPFPGEGGSRGRPTDGAGSSGLPAGSPPPTGSAAYAELAVRFVPTREDRDQVPSASVVLSAMEALAGTGASVSLTGTAAHPTVEGAWRGEDACLLAAEAAADADISIRGSSLGQLCASVGIVRGWALTEDSGVTSRSAAASAVELAERAAPGQVLLGGDAWEREPHLEVSSAAASAVVPTFVLRGLR